LTDASIRSEDTARARALLRLHARSCLVPHNSPLLADLGSRDRGARSGASARRLARLALVDDEDDDLFLSDADDVAGDARRRKRHVGAHAVSSRTGGAGDGFVGVGVGVVDHRAV
jgi:hypothetical protein